MLILTPNFDVCVGVLLLNPLHLVAQLFFPGLLHLLITVLMLGARHSQAQLHLFEIFPPLLPTDRETEQLAEIVGNFATIPKSSIRGGTSNCLHQVRLLHIIKFRWCPWIVSSQIP